MIVLAIDPGSKKCGVAVVASDRGVLRHSVIFLSSLQELCSDIMKTFSVEAIVIGSGTGSARVMQIVNKLIANRKSIPKIEIINEAHSTERAKLRYFQENPPKGVWKFVPLGLQVPPSPYDDYAAVVLAEDFLAHTKAKLAQEESPKY